MTTVTLAHALRVNKQGWANENIIVYQTIHSFRVCGQLLYPRETTSHTQKTFDQGKTVREERPGNENNYNILDKQKEEFLCTQLCSSDRSLINSVPLPA